MTNICLYFQVHQPKRLAKYTFFDIGSNSCYEDEALNKEILLRIAHNCYLPTNALLLKLIRQYDGIFKIAFSLTGIAIEQFKAYCPQVLDSFKALADTGCVEFINETYHHSLSFLFSETEFKEQINLHKKLIKDEFGYEVKTFRNTELIYNNELGKLIETLGYTSILTEGANKILDGRSPNYLYSPLNCEKIKILLRNYPLSDDIAFRFSDHTIGNLPLNTDNFVQRIITSQKPAQIINLFMDYEIFGEHQHRETGIFEFLEKLPQQLIETSEFIFMLPHEASTLPISGILDIPDFISWADETRDLTAWRGNPLQEDALYSIYSLEKSVKASGDINLLAAWRSLTTSDHFYYMYNKNNKDNDIHKYFSPYTNSYDAYINYQNIVSDLGLRVRKKK